MKRSVFLLLMTMLLIGMVGSYFFFSVAASRLSVQQYEAELEVVDARGATIIVAINQKRNVWEDVAQDAQLQRGGAIHDKNGKVVDHSALYYSSEYLYVELFISGTELSLYPIEGPDTAMSLLLDEETSQAAIAALDAYFDKVKTVEDSVKLGAELCSIMDGTQGIPNLQKDDWQLVVAIGGGIVMLGVIVVFELLKKQTRAAKTLLLPLLCLLLLAGGGSFFVTRGAAEDAINPHYTAWEIRMVLVDQRNYKFYFTISAIPIPMYAETTTIASSSEEILHYDFDVSDSAILKQELDCDLRRLEHIGESFGIGDVWWGAREKNLSYISCDGENAIATLGAGSAGMPLHEYPEKGAQTLISQLLNTRTAAIAATEFEECISRVKNAKDAAHLAAELDEVFQLKGQQKALQKHWIVGVIVGILIATLITFLVMRKKRGALAPAMAGAPAGEVLAGSDGDASAAPALPESPTPAEASATDTPTPEETPPPDN